MKQIIMRLALVAAALLLLVFPIHVLAETTLTSPATNLTATVDGSSGAFSGTGAAGTVSLTVTGGTFLSKNGTLTLKNSGSETARLSFSYSVSGTGYSDFTVAGSTGSSSGGTYEAELAAGSSVAIYLKCPKKVSITVTLTNVKLEVASAANVTINHNSLGTVTVDGSTVVSGNTVEVDAAGATFAATPISGATFVGWINTADNSVVTTAASFTYIPTGDASVTAVFTKATEEAWFLTAGKSYLVQGLDNAITSASSASSKVIILAASGKVSSGNYTIPSGVTLLAPFDSDGTLYTTSPGYVEDSYTTPSAFSTLTLADGANITVADGGAISVSAKVSAKMGYAGAPTSKYGHIAMNEGSSITVQSNGKLYAWGFITGAGEVTLKSGATAYESFQVVDWRGGTASSGMLGNNNKVFPMTQYYIQNVESRMVVESGAAVTCSMIADIISVRVVEVQFLGTSGCMFNMTSGSAAKQYDGATDRLILDIDGKLTISSTEIELVPYLYSINLSDYVLPINNNISININDGGNLTVNQDTSLLAGSQLNIAEGGTVTLGSGKRLFVYDETEWKSAYYVYDSAYFRPVRYAPGRTYTRTAAADIIDAQVLVNGTLDASAGYLYTTASGGNICSTGNGVVKTQSAESSPTLYEATQSGTSISYATISVGAGQLKHGDGTYLTTAAGTYKYNAEHKKWVLGDHTITDEVTDPTCTEKGYTTHTCTCGESYTGNETDALGHDYEITESVAATCTEDGYITYTCKNDPTHTYTETLSHAGHSYEEVVTPPTCTAEGYTTYTCAACGDSYIDNYTEKLPHQYVDNTCTGCGEVIGTITKGRFTMELDGVVYLNYYPTLKDFSAGFDFANRGGVLVLDTSTLGEGENPKKEMFYVGSPNCQVIEGMDYRLDEDGNQMWFVQSPEIVAKELGRDVYLRPYIEAGVDADGKPVYVYMDVVQYYSPAKYCCDILKNPDAENDDTENLCAALLQYGMAAEAYFTTTATPVSTVLSKYTQVDLSSYGEKLAYAPGYLDALNDASEQAKALYSQVETAALKYTDADGAESYAVAMDQTLNLGGAIKFSVGVSLLTNDKGLTWDKIDLSKSKVQFWTESDLQTATSLDHGAKCTHTSGLTLEDPNATISLGKYRASSQYIVAKNLGEPVYYICYLVTTDGTVYRSGLQYSSPEKFLAAHLNGETTSENEKLMAVCQRLAVYGEMARVRFTGSTAASE